MNNLLFRLLLIWAKLNGREYRYAHGRLQVKECGQNWVNVAEHIQLDHKEDK